VLRYYFRSVFNFVIIAGCAANAVFSGQRPAILFKTVVSRVERKENTMRFGYFDDQNREYVITRPDTPLPWINYLGSQDYFGLISNTAGG